MIGQQAHPELLIDGTALLSIMNFMKKMYNFEIYVVVKTCYNSQLLLFVFQNLHILQNKDKCEVYM